MIRQVLEHSLKALIQADHELCAPFDDTTEIRSAIKKINEYLSIMQTNQTFEELEGLVIDWALARKIIPNAKPHTQLLKAVSEIGELADGENKGDVHEIKDAIGDVLVCLINYCTLRQITITECLAGAYEEIKNRRGTLLPNGVFVKE